MNRLKSHAHPTPKPTPVPMPTVICKLSANGPITVGQKLDLLCQRAGTSLLSQSTVKFENGDASQPYVIAFLGKPQVDSDQVRQSVTSYKVGGHELNQIHMVVDEKTFLVNPQTMTVQSVIQNQQQSPQAQAKPTPFPIFDPEKVPAPLWWWAIWIGLFAFVAGFLIWQFVKWFREQKRAKEAGPERQKTPQEKFQERLRKLESRDLHQKGEYKAFALELTNILKTAISGHLHFPAEDMTSEELLTTLEKRFRGFSAASGTLLQSMFNDLDQIKFAKIETTTAKCMALLDSSLKVGRALFGDADGAGSPAGGGAPGSPAVRRPGGPS